MSDWEGIIDRASGDIYFVTKSGTVTWPTDTDPGKSLFYPWIESIRSRVVVLAPKEMSYWSDENEDA